MLSSHPGPCQFAGRNPSPETFCDSSNAYTFSSKHQSQSWQIPSTRQKSEVSTRPTVWPSNLPRAYENFQTSSKAMQAFQGGPTMISVYCIFWERTLWLLHLKPWLFTQAVVKWSSERNGNWTTTMENTEHAEQEWVEPDLLSLGTFSKDHPLRCKRMDSIPEKTSLALLTYVILKGTIITQRSMFSRLSPPPHWSSEIIWVPVGSIKNPVLHPSTFLWDGSRGSELSFWLPF